MTRAEYLEGPVSRARALLWAHLRDAGCWISNGELFNEFDAPRGSLMRRRLLDDLRHLWRAGHLDKHVDYVGTEKAGRFGRAEHKAIGDGPK